MEPARCHIVWSRQGVMLTAGSLDCHLYRTVTGLLYYNTSVLHKLQLRCILHRAVLQNYKI